jgi:hypothetical protein
MRLQRRRRFAVVLKKLHRAGLALEAMFHPVLHALRGYKTHKIDAASHQRVGPRVAQSCLDELTASHGKLAAGGALARHGVEARQDGSTAAVLSRHDGERLPQAEHLFGWRSKHNRRRCAACGRGVLGCASGQKQADREEVVEELHSLKFDALGRRW